MAKKTLGQVAYEARGCALNWDVLRQEIKAEHQSVADAVLAAAEAQRWQAISEAHEDYGVCVFVNLRDPDWADPVCMSTLDDDFAEMKEIHGWTHFARIGLTTETAERLKAQLPAPTKEVEHGH